MYAQNKICDAQQIHPFKSCTLKGFYITISFIIFYITAILSTPILEVMPLMLI